MDHTCSDVEKLFNTANADESTVYLCTGLYSIHAFQLERYTFVQPTPNSLLVCVVWIFKLHSSTRKMSYSVLCYPSTFISQPSEPSLVPPPPLSNPLCLDTRWSFGKSLSFTDRPFIFHLVRSSCRFLLIWLHLNTPLHTKERVGSFNRGEYEYVIIASVLVLQNIHKEGSGTCGGVHV